MKIIFLCSEVSRIGGIQQYNRKLLRVLKEFRQEITVVECKLHFLSKLGFVFAFLKQIILYRQDIIFCRHVNYASLAYLAKKILRIPYTLSFYGIDAMDLGFWRGLFVKEAEFVTVPFEWTRRNILRQAPFLRDKVIVLMNPVDEDEFFIKEKSQTLMQKYNYEGAPLILTLARISKDEAERGYKGYDRVINALPLIKKHISNVKYILAGGGDYLNQIKQFIRERGLTNDVILPGQIKDEERIDYYNLCDVFVLPSKDEGCPALVVLEALLCGKPVVIGERECAENALSHGELGLMIDPDNIKAIAEAVIAILRNKPEKLLSGNLLRKRTIEVYGFDEFREKVKTLLTRLSSE